MFRNWQQTGGIAGIIFVIGFVVGVGLQGDVPTYADGGEEVAAWFADNGDQYMIGDFAMGLAIVFGFVPFLAAMYEFLSGAEGSQPVWSRAFLIGGVAWLTVGGVGSIMLGSMALQEGDVSADVAATLSAASYYSFPVMVLTMAVMLGAAAIVIIRTHAMAVWLGWVAAVVAAVAIASSCASIENDPEGITLLLGFLSFLCFGVWILLASFSLIRQKPALSGG